MCRYKMIQTLHIIAGMDCIILCDYYCRTALNRFRTCSMVILCLYVIYVRAWGWHVHHIKISYHNSWCYKWTNNCMWQNLNAIRLILTHWGRGKMADILADDIFEHILLNKNIRISIDSSLKFVPKGQINNIPALVKIMAWRRIGDKPLSEPMLTRFTDAYMRH